jgi:hypothetical protein
MEQQTKTTETKPKVDVKSLEISKAVKETAINNNAIVTKQ